MDLNITSMDFTQIYQLSMMIIGFGGLILGIVSLVRTIKKDKYYRNKKRFKK